MEQPASGDRRDRELKPSDVIPSHRQDQSASERETVADETTPWTFLLTDIEGSVPLWEQDADAMQRALVRHDTVIGECVARHGGTVVHQHGEGDSRFVVFARAGDAIAAACDLQRIFQREAWPTTTPLHVRVALHTGEAIELAGHYYGSAVNRCARLRALAHGGQVVLSETTARLVRGSLPGGADLRDLAEHRLRGFERPERVFQLVHPDLPADFAPLVNAHRPPHNLPAAMTPLLGRDDDVARIRDLLGRDESRLVTLTGPGGVGKTRLALQVALDLLDRFSDGVFLVPLASISDPALVISAMAQALGLQESGGRSVEDTVSGYLHGKHLLLVLDNFEQILPAAPLVADLLVACPTIRALVTSRAALHLRGERGVAVSPLAYPDAGWSPTVEAMSQYPAVALFDQRAIDVREDFALDAEAATAVAEICRRVDGLPLGIELAAAQVRLFTPQALLSRLERRLPLLTGGARDLPERQRTLRDTIAWSYDLLGEAERWLFRRLSVFVGGFTLESSEALCDPDRTLEISALDGLASLIAQSLVRRHDGPRGESRFTMLETIREHGLERLAAGGEEADVRQSHAVYCLGLAERAAPELYGQAQVSWLARLETEHNNMREALRWLAERGDTVTGLRLSTALWRFWQIRGHHTEGRSWVEQMLGPVGGGECTDPPALTLRAAALHGLGALLTHQGNYAAARSVLEESLDICHRVGDEGGMAWSLNGLGWVAIAEGDFTTARSLHGSSLAIARRLGDRRSCASSLNGLGWSAIMQGDHDQARILLDESLVIGRDLGDKRGITNSLVHLGWLAQAQGDHPLARDFVKESLVI
jgi:predicted ATPase/class 3 adenylate cyclase